MMLDHGKSKLTRYEVREAFNWVSVLGPPPPFTPFFLAASICNLKSPLATVDPPF